jgi:drug/metabolite transporter (DMT)-like permease
MSTEIMLVVLFAALLHAGWNAVVKSSPEKFLDTALVTAGGAALAALALPFLAWPQPASWPYLAASVVIHVAYFALVAGAYRTGDMSYAYPLMRGTAPMIVALLSAPILGEHLSPAAWAGVVLICGGVVSLTLVYRHPGRSVLAPTLIALGNAAVIATYTFVDGVGARLSGDAAAYTLAMFLFTGPALLAWAAWRRPAALAEHLRARWGYGVLGGAGTVGAYGLALWAMTQAPVAQVAALRETSILFGMALAALLLKERFGPALHAAAAAVALGAAVLRLA